MDQFTSFDAINTPKEKIFKSLTMTNLAIY